MNFLKIILGILTGLTVFFLILLGYFGFFPPLTKIMGTDKPRNLGISYTATDIKTSDAATKVVSTQVKYKGESPEKTIRYEGKHEAVFSFTSEQLTAIANRFENYIYNPVTNVQIRINTDGTAEASGNIKMETVYDFAKSLGFSQNDVDEARKKFGIISTNPPFYIKGTGSVTNNKTSLNVSSLEIGRIPVPTSMISELTPIAIDIIESKYINRVPGLSVKNLENREGKVFFDGTVFDKETFLTK